MNRKGGGKRERERERERERPPPAIQPTDRVFMPSHQSKLRTLSAQTYKWYGMDAQDVLIVKIPIIRKLYRSLLRY